MQIYFRPINFILPAGRGIKGFAIILSLLVRKSEFLQRVMEGYVAVCIVLAFASASGTVREITQFFDQRQLISFIPSDYPASKL